MTRAGEAKHSLLIVSATAGAGHVRAAEALVEETKHLSLPITIRHEDILNFTSPLFRKIYSEIQFAVVNRSPELWGYFYNKTEFIGLRKQKSPLTKLFDHFNYKKYLATLLNWKPDAVICTHFLPYAAIADEIRQRSWKIPFFAVPTDYDVHSLWIDPSIAHYYVATEEAGWTVKSHGISSDKISVSGIPIMPQFALCNSRVNARKKIGLSPKAFTIMVLSGGYGTGVIDQLVPSIAGFLASFDSKQFELIVVCGKNKKLYETLKRTRFSPNVRTHIYQFIPFVDTLMNCSDILVTKSGGLTVSEALATQLPMILFDPIPGQEGRNADYLVEQGAALIASSFPNLHFKLKQVIENSDTLHQMRGRARAIARPDAAKEILEDVLQRLR